jgi:hypothetical protein
MPLLDLSKNCDISTSSFLDDLRGYSVKDGNIVWTDNSFSAYSTQQNLFENTGNNYWTPNFINNDDLVQNKVISHYGSILGDSSYLSGRIGIEDFITFSPKFKNWDTNGTMIIDWLLHRPTTPHAVEAGLNYWKKNGIAVTGNITIFPIYSKIKHNNIVYIKLDNETVRQVSPNPAQQNIWRTNTDNGLIFNYTDTNADTKVSSLGNNVIFTLFDSDVSEVWIPDGDHLLYFTNQSEKRQNNIDNIGSRSYISGSLYKYYNLFYNSLTAREDLVRLTDKRPVRKLRQYKKLAHALSTSPFVSEFFIAFLAYPSTNIKNAIDDYLNADISDIDTDIINLSTVLNIISTEYSRYEITNSNNIVKNNDELFVKLINKYGAKLRLFSDDAYIRYRPLLKHGDSVIVEEIGNTLVNKNINNTTISSNKKITLRELNLEISMGPTESFISLGVKEKEDNKIPLYNSVKPSLKIGSNINIVLEKNSNGNDPDVLYDQRITPELVDYDPDNSIFYWSMKPGEDNPASSALTIDSPISVLLPLVPKLKAVNIELLTKHNNSQFPNQGIELIDSEFRCVWEKISGPPLRFIDLNKTQTNKKYDKAYGNETAIVPSATGKYVIKCTISSPYGSFTKIKTIFIVDGREKSTSRTVLSNPRRIVVEINSNPFFGTYSLSGSDNLFRDLINNAPFEATDRASVSTSLLNQYRAENIPIQLNRDRLEIFISDPCAIAMHKNGLFCPINTNYYVENVGANSRPIDKLNKNYVFSFDKNVDTDLVPANKNSSINIDYFCGETILKLDRIILRNIRNETEECSQCYSLYSPKFTSYTGGSFTTRRSFFSRTNKAPNGFSLQKYLFDGTEYFMSDVQDYDYPVISSDIAPPIKTYGGYGNKIVKFLPISDLDSLQRPANNILNSDLVAKDPHILPPSTGYKLDYTSDNGVEGYKLCYQQQVMPSGSISFNKGCFLPNSGWVIGDNRHLSSVLKFNPGARKSFSFAGPGLLGLSNYTNSDEIEANIFSSSIGLNINPVAQWDSVFDYDNGVKMEFCPAEVPPLSNIAVNRNTLANLRGIYYMRNQLNRELADQYTGGPNAYHHGYRTLNGGMPKTSETSLSNTTAPQNDEFNITVNESKNSFTYSFNVVGPHNPIGLSQEAQQFIDLYMNSGVRAGSRGDEAIVRDFIENNDGLGLRNPRINGLTIKDIEVQLNFLNYVNTKNLIIWLEIDLAQAEHDSMGTKAGPTALSQIKAQNIFIDQFIDANTHKAFDGYKSQFLQSDEIPIENNSIKSYVEQLTNLNSRDNPGGKMILYLLNQETIQNKEYNFSLKFSDTANKHNVLFDHNMFTSGVVNADQNIVSNHCSVHPTKNIPLENTYTNSTLNNINKLNRLNINNNTFNKLADRVLFGGVAPQVRAPNCTYPFGPVDSESVFTLHIAVMEEEDEMFPMDTIINNDLHTNAVSVEKTLSSANLFNNLCSWELILHTENTKQPITSQVNSLANYGGTDALSLIEYGQEPKYPGYGFIADLREQKFLLPLVNMNAPTTFFQNYNACEYADNDLIGKGVLIDQPRFPTEAIIGIIAGTAVGGLGGSLVGALAGGLGLSYNQGFSMLFDYFKESRQVANLEFAQQETFDIEYDSYPFGNSDKILINASKDGVFWYKMEASIFKLSNTPALPLKQYAVIKNDSSLFKFEFTIVSNISEIIDEIFIPYIVSFATPDNASEEDIKLYQNIDSNKYIDFDFTLINELVNFNKLIHKPDIFQSRRTNNTLLMLDHSLPYSLISIGDTLSFDCDPVRATVISKALVYKEGQYRTVLAVNQSAADLASCSELYLPENVVVVCGSEASTQELDQRSPISLFSLVNDQPPNETIPDTVFSTDSLGSYGNGSSVKNKNILSRKIQINHIDPIYHQLNSFNNDKYYFNELVINLPVSGMAPDSVPTGTPISIKNALEAYPVYYDADRQNILDPTLYHIYDENFSTLRSNLTSEQIDSMLRNINISTKDKNSYTNHHKYNMMYLKIQDSNTIDQLYRNCIGSITIENNYTYKPTIERITQQELNILVNRLNQLNVAQNDTIGALIGVPSNTGRIINQDSIFYLQQHYDELPADPLDCEGPTTCYKARTYSRLQHLYRERSQILSLLEQQTYRKAKIFKSSADFIEGDIEIDNSINIKLKNNLTLFNKLDLFSIQYSYELDPTAQRYHMNEGGIIPDQKVIISETSRTDRSLNIEYEKVSDNYYWINIDPKQSCSIAEEMRPRILKSIKYNCRPTNPSQSTGGVPLSTLNNICPDPNPINGAEHDNFTIEASVGQTSYIFKEEFIEQEKIKWRQKKVTEWTEQQLERKFRINGDKNITSFANNEELLIEVTETYYVAIEPTPSLAKNDFSGDARGDLLNGIDRAQMVGKPTRVYNIFNLDDINNLQIQFRKVPRLMRGIDFIGTVLRYGENSSYRPQRSGGAGSIINPTDIFNSRPESLINNFYQWKCYQKNPTTQKIDEAQMPEFFHLLNEMIFRAFFGSVDEIENKNPQLRSLYDFEMIPYEYFTKPLSE